MVTRKRRSVRNAKRPTLAEQWDAYDAAVIGTYNRNQSELSWVEQGEVWAREFVSKPYAAKEISSRSFNPESDAAESWSDTATEIEARDGIGWLGVQIGFVGELERLTGQMFSRFSTANAADALAKWEMPMQQIQKLFKRPRGARP